MTSAELLAAIYPRMLSLAKRHQAAAGIVDADDIAQEAAIRLMRAIEEGHLSRASEKALYCYARIAVEHATIDLFRKRNATKRGGQAERAALDLIDEPEDAGLSPEEEALQREARSALEVKISALSDYRREITEMKFYEDLTITEIACRVGRPFSTVQFHLASVIDELEHEMRQFFE